MNIYGEFADIAALDERVAAKLIARKEHPTLEGVRLYNYTPVAQFSQAWDEHILQARGLVTAADGKILARPFSKFFNHDEREEVYPWDKPFEVTAKMDGSMFLAARTEAGDLITATRGSFDSTQARWAREMIQDREAFEVGLTYVFELIHPQNRIVVDYGDMRDLVLLGVIETATGEEVPRSNPLGRASVGHYYFAGIQDGTGLLALETPNAEGFVVRFCDGRRVKVKFAEYRRLHRIITGVSTKTIWEALRDGNDLAEILDRVPDEFNEFVRVTIADLTAQYREREQAGKALAELAKGLPSRKEQAAVITREPKNAPIAFSILDGKDYALGIWRSLEPEFKQPFASRELV